MATKLDTNAKLNGERGRGGEGVWQTRAERNQFVFHQSCVHKKINQDLLKEVGNMEKLKGRIAVYLWVRVCADC